MNDDLLPHVMKIRELATVIDATILCGEELLDGEVHCGFASDLMSDVLTLESHYLVLITGLSSPQTMRTAEMADISCVVLVRDKKADASMIEIAEENQIVLLGCSYSMFRTVGKLYQAGLKPVY